MISCGFCIYFVSMSMTSLMKPFRGTQHEARSSPKHEMIQMRNCTNISTDTIGHSAVIKSQSNFVKQSGNKSLTIVLKWISRIRPTHNSTSFTTIAFYVWQFAVLCHWYERNQMQSLVNIIKLQLYGLFLLLIRWCDFQPL